MLPQVPQLRPPPSPILSTHCHIHCATFPVIAQTRPLTFILPIPMLLLFPPNLAIRPIPYLVTLPLAEAPFHDLSRKQASSQDSRCRLIRRHLSRLETAFRSLQPLHSLTTSTRIPQIRHHQVQYIKSYHVQGQILAKVWLSHPRLHLHRR